MRNQSLERPPLSCAQQRMWFLNQLEPGAEYLETVPLSLRGWLDADALRRALLRVAARHEVLRTRYELIDGTPRQVIDGDGQGVQMDIRWLDLEDLPEEERRRRAAEVIDNAARRPFDLQREHPIRAELVRLEQTEHLLVLVLHHVASDAWSLRIITRELRVLYGAISKGLPSPLASLEMQYADFAVWQREQLDQGRLEHQAAYWRKRLAGLTPLELAADRPRPAGRDARGGVVELSIPAERVRALTELGRAERATPFMVLLAAFQLLLARSSGRTDVAVGTPIAGRTRAEDEDLIGCFLNMLVIRTCLAGDPPFIELLRRVRERALEAYEHQEFPFEQLVNELQPQRDLSRNPLFQVAFILQGTPRVPFELPGLSAERLPAPRGTSKFDLTLRLEKRPDGSLGGEVEYARALFDRSTAERIAGWYTRLLDAAVSHPDASLEQLGRRAGIQPAVARAGGGEADGQAAGRFEVTPLDLGVEYVAPRSADERRMAGLWAEVLGQDEDLVGVDHSFFDLGGDSIRAVRLVGVLRDHGFALTVQDVFRHPTVARLAEAAGSSSPPPTESRVEPFSLIAPAERAELPAGIDDAYPLSMAQAGMVYEMAADPDLRPYHNVFCYRVDDGGEFSAAALRAALEVLIERHEVLRTSIHLVGYDDPLQLVHHSVAADLEVHDLRHLDRTRAGQAAEDFLGAASTEVFDLTRAPLLQVAAHVLHDHWRLTILDCHAILDGWSHNLLLNELLQLYHEVRGCRRPSPDPRPDIRFADFIALEQVALDSAESREFWSRRIHGAPRLQLPDRWSSLVGGERFHDVRLPIDDLEAGLRLLASDAEVPLKSVLLAAHLAAMARATGQERFFTGLVCDGRPEVTGGDRVAGMFLNTVPFPARIDASSSRDLVRTVFLEETAQRPHRRFPFPAMQHAWGGRTRLLDALFAYLDFHVVDRRLVDVAGVIKHNPIEFALQVTAEPGQLLLTCRACRIAPEHGERLGRLHREVLESMAMVHDRDRIR